MPYDQLTNRHHPQLLVFDVDESGSMREHIGLDETGTPLSKTDATVRALKEEVFEEAIFNSQHSGSIQNVFHAFGIGFGARVRDLWGGRVLETAELAQSLSVRAQGGTPLCAGLIRVRDRLAQLLPSYQDSNPPAVFVLSDGRQTDTGDAAAVAREIREMTTKHGNVLVIAVYLDLHVPNAQLSAQEDPSWPEAAKVLFRLASEVPMGSYMEQWFVEHAAEYPKPPQAGDRLFFQVGDISALRAAVGVVASTLTNSQVNP